MLPKAKIDIPKADERVERIGKTAYEMLNNNRISQNRDQPTYWFYHRIE